MKKIVVIGGGSGLAGLLRGIRDYPIDITAIVTMTDDGASSGRLRRDFNLLPPGDIRKCIAALSENETSLLELFQYRFKGGLGLRGHSLGNLLITAMKEITGSFELSIEEISRLLRTKGRVLPSTLDDVNLVARFKNGRKILGESKITRYGYKHEIQKISLTKKAKTNPEALEAINNADLIVIGPGSLYTSIIPNFLQNKMRDAVRLSPAVKLYVCNVSTERGETMGYGVKDHVDRLISYGVPIDFVLVNNRFIYDKGGDKYVTPVLYSKEAETPMPLLAADLIEENNPLYHSSEKLGMAIWKLINNQRKFTKKGISGKIIEL